MRAHRRSLHNVVLGPANPPGQSTSHEEFGDVDLDNVVNLFDEFDSSGDAGRFDKVALTAIKQRVEGAIHFASRISTAQGKAQSWQCPDGAERWLRTAPDPCTTPELRRAVHASTPALTRLNAESKCVGGGT